MSYISIPDGPKIPAAIFDQHIILLGKTRSGKSSVARFLAEFLLKRGDPVCIVDPKGDWWGLKSSASGKEAGYPVVIFGGEHCDVPINERSGAAIAELAATENRPCIIDLGGWMPGPRTQFWIDFASTFFRSTRGRRWLIVDEVHNFCPKGKIMDPNAGKMLHWSNRLASEGLGKGMGLIAASQRPQKVHNDFLTSCETLIAMRVIHKADRDALRDWIDACGEPETGKELLNTAASMQRGEGWVYSPEAKFGPVRIQFPMFSTYDSFKPQAAHQAARLKGWADVDLGEVRKKLETAVKEAEANDPTLLKRKIAELQKELGKKPAVLLPATGIKTTVNPPDARAIERAVKAAGKSYLEILSRDVQALREIAKAAERIVAIADKQINAPAPKVLGGDVIHHPAHHVREIQTKESPRNEAVAGRGKQAAAHPLPNLASHPALRHTVMRTSVTSINVDGSEGLTPYMRDILRGLAELHAVGRAAVPWSLAGVAAGKSHKSSTFERYAAKLKADGLVIYPQSGFIALTDAGHETAGAADASLSAEDLQQRCLRLLTPYQREILQAVLSAWPEQISWEDVGAAIGKSAASSTFERYMASLRSFEMLDYAGVKQVRAAPWLFLE